MLVEDRQMFSLLFCSYHKENSNYVIPAYIKIILKCLLKSRSVILKAVGFE
jgi:hypothetical protein